MELERLDKLLAGSGCYTRSQARNLIAGGQVTVDGAVIRKPETKVSRAAVVLAEGKTIETAEFVYYMMNKPSNTISATEDGAYPAVTSLLPRHLRTRGLFPVGRLDVDVTGLLLLTDDGGFAHRVTAPRSEIRKTYEIMAEKPLRIEDIAALAAGVTMTDGTAYRPAELVIDEKDEKRGTVTVTEGKFHEVKNLIAARGNKVLAMRRVSVGGLSLDEKLAPGGFRPLTETERTSIFL